MSVHFHFHVLVMFVVITLLSRNHSNVAEGLAVKLIMFRTYHGRWVDEWKSGTFFLYSSGLSPEPQKHHQDCLMSTAQLLSGCDR